jgi:hypothetical protein
MPIGREGARSMEAPRVVGLKLNKLETRFAEMLRESPLVSRWYPQAVKLRLAGTTSYTPDFFVILRDGRQAMVETKGWLREDAAIKIKVAADMYPCWDWYLVYAGNGHAWRVREVTSRGIGRHDIRVEWIT